MIQIIRPAIAGTMESNDILVSIAPAKPGEGIQIELNSPVKNQYGLQIEAAIRSVIERYGIRDILIQANDKGALDCTIEARIETAILRAAKGDE
ncbi:citrate lyase acyl carrier protein [bacterium BFN5]|nr:citrate lyase acyl carrier protein [bacterium BFN5]